MIHLREYQTEALQAILASRSKGITRQLVALPTGTGKTILFGALARELDTRTLVIAHREELLVQAKDKIQLVFPEADLGIVKAERNEVDHQIVIASIQTISRPNRMEQMQEQGFNLMIVDEAHHAISDSYRTTIEGLGFMGDDPAKLLVGLTATPKRMDGQALGNVFQQVVFQRSLPTMIAAGYLCDLKAVRIKAGTSLVGVHTRMGDFAPGELEAAVNTEQRNRIIVASYKKYAAKGKAAAFCAGVQHSQDLAEAFRADGIKAAAVYGDMDPTDRRATLQAYAHGEIQVLTNCEVLTEGWDDPGTDCLIMARPTKSSGLYTQMIGRGTRLYPGKENCLVLEFTDNRHDVCSLGSLTGLPLKDKQSLKEAIRADEGRQEPNQAADAKRVVAREYALIDRSKFRWFPVDSDWRLPTGVGAYIHLHLEEADRYTVTLTAQGETTLLASSALPLGYAMGIAEDHARLTAKHFAAKDAKWAKKPATGKQLATLARLHIDFPEDISKGGASLLIGQELARRDMLMKEPASGKQLYVLRQAGFEVDSSLTKREAAQLFKRMGVAK